MIPCTSSLQTAQFPRCVNWLLNNQLLDGSWGLPDRHHLLVKDALLSTLASVLALKQWGVGERQIVRGSLIFPFSPSSLVTWNLIKTGIYISGLEFIALNSSSVADGKQHSPIGFDIILSRMIDQAKYLNLNLPFRQSDIDIVHRRRNIELKRYSIFYSIFTSHPILLSSC